MQYPKFYNYLDTIQVVLGDFNINAQDQIQVERLSQIFHNYKQIVDNSTHFGGATLDHIYIKKDFQENVNLEYFVKAVYFSDHDAIQLKVALKIRY